MVCRLVAPNSDHFDKEQDPDTHESERHCCGSETFWYGTVLDPRNCTNDLWIRILFFSSVADKMPKNRFFSKFFAYYSLKVHLNLRKNVKKKSQNTLVESKGFLTFFACW
jgi:hypothetical protein